MKKKKKSPAYTLLLLLLVVAVLSVAYVLLVKYNRNKEADKAQKEADKQAAASSTFLIHEEEAEKIQSLTLNSDKIDITLIRKDDAWVVQGEESFPLDNDKVEELVAAFAALRASKTVSQDGQNLSDYGLEEPAITVTATKSDGLRATLCIGDKLAVASDYYGKMEDNPSVYVIPLATRTKYNISKDELFYMMEVPSITTDQLREIQVAGENCGNFHFVYDADNPLDYTGGTYSWYSINENRNPVNLDNMSTSDMFNSFVTFTFDNGVGYGEEALKQYGLTEAATMIYIKYEEDSKEKEFMLHVGNQDEEGYYYVAIDGSDLVYKMSADVVSPMLEVVEEDMLSNFVHIVNIANLDSMVIMTDESSSAYQVKRDTSTTTYYKNEVAYDDASVFQSFYQKVISIKRAGNLKKTEVANGDPVLIIQFTLTDGTQITAKYYPYDDDYYAVFIDEKPRFTVAVSEVKSTVFDEE